MKITELNQKTKEELKKTASDLKEKIRQFRFDLSSGKVKNVKSIRAARKDVARILTIMNLKNSSSVKSTEGGSF
ncbi:MAG: 50S ribosomal protein L29 [Candidatus Nealsonbacteria bacterium RIFCSPLOWO2_12_FULL_39_31]|uniref:Large ribosomal subunit protein uL29 n=2 Tax=Candidatus Nealsoniibacteriota TaxID=1817911 RepID=A0A1G2EMN1_9BACT|nr:MAG: 50S ribosomal protein L29 [Parcubacteria group bacterium GW2011_GWA2_38_27]KKQ96722.1 MAG: 50S ribosomal protein L29 [Parcubacteria group bacterium GW2011_GWC2_39_11]OGZ19498.1 MAG: 50S ribosomal protein L29 [Candidatus Nealsonbacteria bacterium RIFCSPHIGHO2_01_FULL_38_55]OGZ21110.1 MAG: 50S ribosomal protein L29 [Candidatus Nealsonbacteria bacterium RIFCSPHIGHO2_02_38_10]OGZ21537.1 MAG: 50S ribosomal protein L29 [Candidatus Nealsonbacteria bacterium RIFCSPHIGHO2_02_FULL_38_75]OGZ22807